MIERGQIGKENKRKGGNKREGLQVRMLEKEMMIKKGEEEGQLGKKMDEE